MAESVASGRQATAGLPSMVERSQSNATSRILVPTPSLASAVWELVSPLLWRLVVFYTKIFLVLASLAILVITTVLLYSLVYWMAVPKRLHTYPVFFNYDATGAQFACANVSLSGRQWEGLNRPIIDWQRPTAGFEFDVSISLEFPANQHNLHLGPVMIETRALLKSHQQVALTQRAVLLPQLSALGRVFRDFVTMALAGLLLYQDKTSVDVLLIESLPVLAQESSLSYINICMRPPVHVYSATLSFVSKLSGFRYLIAHHPLTVGVVVVGAVLTLAIIFMIGAYISRFYKRNQDDPLLDDDEEAVGPISPVSPREEPFPAEEHVDTNLRRRTIRD